MRLSQSEFQARVRDLQREEERRKVACRRQEDFAVFVSYSRTDKETAQRIVDLFNELELMYMIDEKEIGWGDDIREFMSRKVADCTHYLLIVSDASARSPWCAFELGVALGTGKEILLFRNSEDVSLPACAAHRLATTDIDVVRGYFSQDLIPSEKVEELLAEIIDDPRAALAEFNRVETPASGRIRWDAPDREAIESQKPDPLAAYIDGRRDAPLRLVSVELGDPFDETCLALHYASPDRRPQRYAFGYRPELKGVLVTPRKERSQTLGVRVTGDDGSEKLVGRVPSFEESLESRDLHGWNASASFWKKTLEVLKARLSS